MNSKGLLNPQVNTASTKNSHHGKTGKKPNIKLKKDEQRQVKSAGWVGLKDSRRDGHIHGRRLFKTNKYKTRHRRPFVWWELEDFPPRGKLSDEKLSDDAAVFLIGRRCKLLCSFPFSEVEALCSEEHYEGCFSSDFAVIDVDNESATFSPGGYRLFALSSGIGVFFFWNNVRIVFCVYVYRIERYKYNRAKKKVR